MRDHLLSAIGYLRYEKASQRTPFDEAIEFIDCLIEGDPTPRISEPCAAALGMAVGYLKDPGSEKDRKRFAKTAQSLDELLRNNAMPTLTEDAVLAPDLTSSGPLIEGLTYEYHLAGGDVLNPYFVIRGTVVDSNGNVLPSWTRLRWGVVGQGLPNYVHDSIFKYQVATGFGITPQLTPGQTYEYCVDVLPVEGTDANKDVVVPIYHSGVMTVSVPAAPPLQIIGVSEVFTEARRVRRQWTTVDNNGDPVLSTGHVKYGLTANNLDERTTGQSTFEYSTHSQIIGGELTPDTTYYYQIYTTDINGANAESSVLSFRTAALTTANPNFPAVTDKDQPNAGLFIGPAITPGKTGDQSMANQHCVGWMVLNDSPITMVRIHKRMIVGYEYATRYPDCTTHNLDQGQCGAYYGSYGMGTPMLVAEAYAQRTDGLPDEAQLIATQDVNSPTNFEATNDFDFVDMPINVPSQPVGTFLSFWLKNVNPVPGEDYPAKGSATKARAMRGGKFALNGLQCKAPIADTNGGRLRGDRHLNHYYKDSMSDPWRLSGGSDRGHTPYFQVIHADGTIYGNVYDQNSSNPNTKRSVEGNNYVRQVLNMDRTVTVDRLVAYVGQFEGADGSSLTFELLDSNETVLRTVNIPYSSELNDTIVNIPDNASGFDRFFGERRQAEHVLSFAAITLASGSTYYCRIRSATGSGFYVLTMHRHPATNNDGPISDISSGIYAEHSGNAGNTWEGIDGGSTPAVIPFSFVPQGFPDQYGLRE